MKQMRHTTPTTNIFPGIDSNIMELKRERVESHNFKAFIFSSFFIFISFFSLVHHLMTETKSRKPASNVVVVVKKHQ